MKLKHSLLYETNQLWKASSLFAKFSFVLLFLMLFMFISTLTYSAIFKPNQAVLDFFADLYIVCLLLVFVLNGILIVHVWLGFPKSLLFKKGQPKNN